MQRIRLANAVVWVTLGLLSAVAPASGADVNQFKLAGAIPADAMVVVLCRDHDGRDFLDKQYQRVWDAIEKQNFDRDLKRMMRGMVQQGDGDVEAFDKQWQQVSDLAAAVQWSRLGQREFAFAMKLGMPMGSETILLFMPPADTVEKDFEGLAGILKNLVQLAPPEALELRTDGEGPAVVHRVVVAGAPIPLGATLARQKDVILFGVGGSLVDQALALLRGETKSDNATLASTDRFRQALKSLPPAKDQLTFLDVSKLLSQVRVFAKAAAAQAEMPPAETQPSTQPAPADWVKLVDALMDRIDMWEYIASVESTEGMKTVGQSVTQLRADAASRPLFGVFYGGKPLKEPLKYVPVDATFVTVNAGGDLGALYAAIKDFVSKEVPEGKALLAQWEEQQKTFAFNVEQDLLSWLGSGFTSYTAAGASAYAPDWVWMLAVRDEKKANVALSRLYEQLSTLLEAQQGGVEDATIEGPDGSRVTLEGFKVVLLPPFVAMFAGQPALGVRDGHLFLGSSSKAVAAALDVGAGKKDNFTKSERFKKEGLPVGDDAVAFTFSDLSKLGDELSQLFAMAGMIQMMLPAEAQRDQTVISLLSVANKLGRVVKTLDFYRSSCSVTTFDGKICTTKTLTNYQEPPAPKPQAPAGDEASPEGAKAKSKGGM